MFYLSKNASLLCIRKAQSSGWPGLITILIHQNTVGTFCMQQLPGSDESVLMAFTRRDQKCRID